MTSDEQRDDGAAALLEEAMRLIGDMGEAFGVQDFEQVYSLEDRYEAWREGRGANSMDHREDALAYLQRPLHGTAAWTGMGDWSRDDRPVTRADLDAERADMRRELVEVLFTFNVANAHESFGPGNELEAQCIERLLQGQDARGERGEEE